MPTTRNTINLGPTRMQLVTDEVAGCAALTVWQDCEPVATIYTKKDGGVWGNVRLWYPGADGERQPFSVGMRDVEAVLLLRQLLAGLDFSAARKARQAVAL